MKWNKEQLAAINTVDTNILVSASAGAGKTAVLVERLIKRCLIDKVSLNRILAMTFTEAAAMEMKKRLAKRLNEELLKTTDQEYIKQQLIYLETANISTIHSFCLNVIKKHYSALHLNPALCTNILSSGNINQIHDELFNQTLKMFLASDYEHCKQLVQFFSSRPEDNKAFKKALIDLSTMANASFSSAEFYQMIIADYQPIKVFAEFPLKYQELIFHKLNFDLSVQQLYLSKLIRLADLINHEKLSSSLLIKLNFLVDWETALESKNYDYVVNAMRRYCLKKIDALPRGLEDELKIPFQETKKMLNEQIKEIFSYYLLGADLVSHNNQMSVYVNLLVKMAKYFQEEYQKYKLNNQCMDFADMEKLAYEIVVADDNRVANLLKQDFDEILVDEFQDTNTIQNQIVELISQGNNVFRVGDVKQSIYRFRQAKPSIMRKLMNDSDTFNISLGYNYRSNQRIVEFNNELFKVCMNISGFKDTYRQVDEVKPGTEKQCDHSYDIDFYMVNNDFMDSRSNKQVKAEFIASKIQEMRQNSEFKNYRDYVILARSHQDKQDLIKAFKKYCIPYEIDAKEGFWNNDCATLFISYFKLIADFSEINLCAILLSSFYEYTPEKIANLKLQYSSLTKAYEQDQALVAVQNDVEKARKILANKGILATLNYLAKINDILQTKLSTKQRTNFYYLYEKVQQFMKIKPGLHDFLQMVEASIDDRSNEAVSVSSQADVVRMITIHHSKGLQFPVVFYYSTSKNINQDNKNIIVLDESLGLGINYYDTLAKIKLATLQRQAIDYYNELEDLEEGIRVLYVALTRPKEKLIIVDNDCSKLEKGDVNHALLSLRQGNSSIILNSITNYPYFKKYEVLDYPEGNIEQPLAINIDQPMVLPETQSSLTISFIKPSTTHANLTLNFNQQIGTSIGVKLHEIFEELPNTVWQENDLLPYDLSEAQKQSILSFAQSSIYQKCLKMKIKKEYSFATLINQEIYHGIIDFFAYNEEQAIIIDYKSDYCQNCKELKQKYVKQIEAYRIAMENVYPNLVITSYIYSIHLQQFCLID